MDEFVFERGRISKYYTIWCGSCGDWDHIPLAKTVADAKKWALSNGWKYSRSKGYICSECISKEVLGDE